jgi:hypothetical protein
VVFYSKAAIKGKGDQKIITAIGCVCGGRKVDRLE